MNELFLGFLDMKTVLVIAHVFGAILGAGGAFASDGMFFSTIKDGRINQDELRFLKLGSKMVWLGLALLVASGILLVLDNPERYLHSAKFLAKVTIVGILTLNGIIFHFIHLPHIRNHVGLRFAESPTFVKRASFLLASGAVSIISWVATVALGVMSRIPHSYGAIMAVYGVILAAGLLGAILLKKRLLHFR